MPDLRLSLLFIAVILLSTAHHQLPITFVILNPEIKLENFAPKEVANAYLIAGYNYYIKQDYQKAGETFEKGLSYDNSNKKLRLWLQRSKEHIK